MRKLIVKKLVQAGRFLFEAGVVEYYSGNLSVFHKRSIFITRSGSPLPLLKPQDILEIKLKKPYAGRPSSEFVVHRQVYLETQHKAVAHAHPPAVVKIAFKIEGKFYTPRDNEARLLLGEKIPILTLERPSASEELAKAVAKTLKVYPCAIVRSHGVFCGCRTIERAAGLITALEFSAKVFPDV